MNTVLLLVGLVLATMFLGVCVALWRDGDVRRGVRCVHCGKEIEAGGKPAMHSLCKKCEHDLRNLGSGV